MNDWPTVQLAEFLDNGEMSLQTGPFGTQFKASEYVEVGIPVINVKNIGYRDLRKENLDYIEEKTAHRLRVHRLQPGDIVFGRKGSADRHALITNECDGWVQGSDCMRLRIKSDRLSSDYLSYYFCTSGHKDWMEAVCSFGATMTTLNQGIVRRITLPLPPVVIQQKISAVLSAYDELIDSNMRQIDLLERMAGEIYREWFMRLRFPGHEQVPVVKGVPAGWELKKLGEITHITMGQSPPSDSYNEVGDGMPFHQGVGTYGSRFPITVTYCNVNGRRAKKGDILFSVRAPVGRINISDCDLIIGRGLAAMRHKLGLNSYLFYMLRAIFANEDIIGNGSIFNSVGKDELLNFQFLQPSDELAMQFQTVAEKIDNQIEALSRSIDLLIKSRNLLLPRLISGKLSVADLDIQFPPSMAAPAT
jgi:type I restriction enzyme S subunit